MKRHRNLSKRDINGHILAMLTANTKLAQNREITKMPKSLIVTSNIPNSLVKKKLMKRPCSVSDFVSTTQKIY